MNKFLSMPKFEADNEKNDKVEAIQDSVVYIKKVGGHLPKLYYLIAWKGYLEKENT